MARHAIIVGANGQIGRATGERLLRAGWSVTCAQRGEPLSELIDLGARSIHLDRNEPGALRAALKNGADAVIDTIAFDEKHAEQLLEIQDVVGQFSVVSTGSVYRDERGRTLDEAKSLHTLPHFPVIAAVIEAALEASFRGPLNAADPLTPTVREIATIIAHALSWDCEFVTVPSDDEMEGVGVTPWSGVNTIVVDMRAAAQIGYKPVTDYALYAPEVCRWLIDAAPGADWRELFPVLKLFPNMFDYAAEDNFLNASATGIPNVSV